MTPISIERWRKAQGQRFPDHLETEVRLGPLCSDSWMRDPKHLVFTLSRYKFVAKMLAGMKDVAEVGCGDAWPTAIVRREVGSVRCYDISPLAPDIGRYDVMSGSLPKCDAIYALDVFEHVKSGELFFCHLTKSLRPHGRLIVGLPSLEGQTYASEPSRKLHINCVSGERLRSLAQMFFRHVFMFSMNDEVVHTGFMPMAHYLFAVCAEPIDAVE